MSEYPSGIRPHQPAREISVKFALGNQRVIAHGDHFIAPGAIVIGSVVLGRDVSIWFNSVVRGDDAVITIGDGSQVQDGAVLHCDPDTPVTIGRNVSIGHMAMLHGCTIGDGTLIGIKAVVLNNARIGKNCLIGANTLIGENKEIPDGVLVVGSPGKIVRHLTPDEIKVVNSFAHDYQAKFKRYKAELRVDDAR
jgi:carbonic anhydrase/acetyltransferase-like protein (isoleucine patch superfamily)